jgi:hypothetical protein
LPETHAVHEDDNWRIFRRDNSIDLIECLLDYGADPALPNRDGFTAMAIVAHRGRAAALDLFERRAAIERELSVTVRRAAFRAGRRYLFLIFLRWFNSDEELVPFLVFARFGGPTSRKSPAQQLEIRD